MKPEMALTLPCTEEEDFTPASKYLNGGGARTTGTVAGVNNCASILLSLKGRHGHGRKHGAVWEAL